jgi:hypothetical protein
MCTAIKADLLQCLKAGCSRSMPFYFWLPFRQTAVKFRVTRADVEILLISQKNLAIKSAFLTKTKVNFAEKVIMTLVF